MSTESKRGEGIAEKIGGSIKHAIGSLVGDEQMKAEGAAKEAEGVRHEETAKAEERAKGTVEKAAGAVESGVGNVIGNEKLAVEGKVKEVEGEVRKETNR